MNKINKNNTNKKMCTKCTTEKNRDKDFYADFTPNSLNADKRLPICKVCMWEWAGDSSDMATIKKILQAINRPFLYNIWDSAIAEAKDEMSIFKTYMKNLQMRQNKTLVWEDSVERQSIEVNKYSDIEIDSNVQDGNEFSTGEMKRKWGNFDSEDYYKLEDFYTRMCDSNKIETPQDETYVKKLSVISLKMDKELEAGNYAQAKQLGDLFSKYMTDSKLRAMDQSDASKTGGLRTFSQIYAEVEKDEFIPPWEEYRKIKGLEQDIVDKTIMHILNYTLKLNKMPQLTEPPTDTPSIDEDWDNE